MSAPAPVASDDLPVTVSFTRRADPGQSREMTAWIRAGLSMAEGFPGFLGGGWVRPRAAPTSGTCSAASPTSARSPSGTSSPERQWWLRSGEGLAEVTRTERRTGIEGWFDRRWPGRSAPPAGSAPPRWKQAVTIWLVFFPVNLLTTVTLGGLLAPARRRPGRDDDAHPHADHDLPAAAVGHRAAGVVAAGPLLAGPLGRGDSRSTRGKECEHRAVDVLSSLGPAFVLAVLLISASPGRRWR